MGKVQRASSKAGRGPFLRASSQAVRVAATKEMAVAMPATRRESSSGLPMETAEKSIPGNSSTGLCPRGQQK